MDLKFEIAGRVQGVGFRPFIYRIATRFGLKGVVFNDGEGVKIFASADKIKIEKFKKALFAELPPLAKIEKIKITETLPQNFTDFKIVKSENSRIFTPILPDFAICDDCKMEFYDPKNERFHYPFINCTNCGPRLSIIKALPYDRKNTTMNAFKMCEMCEDEYKNPLNRRYHAEPISCRKCGPELFLKNMQGKILASGEEGVRKTAELLHAGKIVAVKGMGGFHIMADACNFEAVKTLRERKHRPNKPFAVMCKDENMAKKIAFISPFESKILNSNIKPILILKMKNSQNFMQNNTNNFTKNSEILSNFNENSENLKKNKNFKTSSNLQQNEKFKTNSQDSWQMGEDYIKLAQNIAPNLDKIGIFLPNTGLHLLLFEYFSNPLIATSANISGEPIIFNEDVLLKKLFNVVDFYLDNNREILTPSDDSIAQSLYFTDDFDEIDKNGFVPNVFENQNLTQSEINGKNQFKNSHNSETFKQNIFLKKNEIFQKIGNLKKAQVLYRTLNFKKNIKNMIPAFFSKNFNQIENSEKAEFVCQNSNKVKFCNQNEIIEKTDILKENEIIEKNLNFTKFSDETGLLQENAKVFKNINYKISNQNEILHINKSVFSEQNKFQNSVTEKNVENSFKKSHNKISQKIGRSSNQNEISDRANNFTNFEISNQNNNFQNDESFDENFKFSNKNDIFRKSAFFRKSKISFLNKKEIYKKFEIQEKNAFSQKNGILNENQAKVENLFEIANIPNCFTRSKNLRKCMTENSIFNQKVQFLRTSRGLNPKIFISDFKCKGTFLALGSELKNQFAIYKDGLIFISPYIGDLKNIATFDRFLKLLQIFTDAYELKFDCIIGDLHPNFLHTKYFEKQGFKVIKFQHHFSHLVCALAENSLLKSGKKFLGFSFDGTGYGLDGHIWGGEVMIFDEFCFTRVAKFEEFSLIGGDNAIKNIYKIAISLIFKFGIEKKAAKFLAKFDKNEVRNLKILEKKSIKTSSLGRIFDAFACVICNLDKITYDGEAGMNLEKLYIQNCVKFYEFELKNGEIKFGKVFEQIFSDEPCVAATKFVNGIAELISKIASNYENDVVLSGGVFQNKTLMNRISKNFAKIGRKFYANLENPTNDSGIAYGQLNAFLSQNDKE